DGGNAGLTSATLQGRQSLGHGQRLAQQSLTALQLEGGDDVDEHEHAGGFVGCIAVQVGVLGGHRIRTARYTEYHSEAWVERSVLMSVSLCVGGLAFTTRTDGLRDAFARCGPVQSAAVMTDRETGRSRGFGFVEMASEQEAERAMIARDGSR